MANNESTAVNALIDLVQAKPLGQAAPADDLFSGAGYAHLAELRSSSYATFQPRRFEW